MKESTREAFVAFITINDEEILLNFGPGDHTCERWKIDEDQLRLIVQDGIQWLLERRHTVVEPPIKLAE